MHRSLYSLTMGPGFEYLNFRTVVHIVEVCGNIWFVDGVRWIDCHQLPWNAVDYHHLEP